MRSQSRALGVRMCVYLLGTTIQPTAQGFRAFGCVICWWGSEGKTGGHGDWEETCTLGRSAGLGPGAVVPTACVWVCFQREAGHRFTGSKTRQGAEPHWVFPLGDLSSLCGCPHFGAGRSPWCGHLLSWASAVPRCVRGLRHRRF